MSMRTFRLVVVAVLTAAALVSAVRAGSPGSWTRVTDTGGQNIDEVGLARTGDGVLHVVWPRRLPTQGQIWHRPISRIGHLGSATTAAARWDAVENPDLVVLPNGTLRLFFAGLGSTFAQGGIQSATAPAFGASWVPQGSRVSASVGAGGPVGATVLSDGTPIFTWASGTDLFVHVGLRSSDPDLNVGPSPRCCFYLPNVERDRASGQVVIAFHSLVEGGPGIFVQPIRPAVGPRRLVPSSLTKGNFVPPDQRTPLVARSAGGLYVAFCKGYPTCRSVRLWKVGSAKPLTVASGGTIEDVNAAPGPDGRIWVMWQNSASTRVYAKRSNRAATRFGPPTVIKPPAGTTSIWKVDGEGSLGTLDLLVSVSTAGSLATWHTQVRPRLSLSCNGGKVVSCIVTDAGDPVAGAKVKIGGKTRVSNSHGKAAANAPPGLLTVVASKGGYKGASTRVRSK
jgi:hypothetical protein